MSSPAPESNDQILPLWFQFERRNVSFLVGPGIPQNITSFETTQTAQNDFLQWSGH